MQRDTAMRAEENKRAVIEAWRLFKTRDARRIAEVFTDDAEWIAPKGNATALALNATDHMVGSEAIADFLASGMHKLFYDVRIDFRSVVADGDTVVVEESMAATLPDGKAYENDYCFFFILHNGKIKQVREYMDTYKGHQAIFG